MLHLASAFRLRNKLKEKISTITEAIEQADFTKDAGTEENTSPCDGKTLAQAIQEGSELMDLLQVCNARIDKANQVNREALIALETCKAKIAFYEKIAKQCRQCRTSGFEYDEQGERVKVVKEALVDQKGIIAALAKFKKEKDALEERLAALNVSTPVDFDPEAILSRI